MPSRRFHAKSRHGCSQCKRRRVKCDLQQRPACGQCLKREIECDFSTPDLDSPASAGSSRSPTPPLHHPPPFALRPDQELIRHYVQVVAPSLSTNPDRVDLWARETLEESAKHPFLLHGVLALSAISIYRLQPYNVSSRLSLARKHHAAALISMRERLLRIDENNFAAVEGLGRFIMGVELMFAVVDPSVDIVANCRACMKLLKGLAMLSKTTEVKYQDYHYSGPTHLHESEEGPPQKPGAMEAIQALHSWNVIRGGHRADVYARAIEGLRKRMRAVESQSENPGLVTLWLLHVNDDFFDAVEEGDELALAILGHFAVVEHQVSHWTWVDDRGMRLLTAVEQRLGRQQESCIRWPVGVMRPSSR